MSERPADVSERPQAAPRVSIWHHVCSAILIGLFAGAGAMRLNDCDLFNPDSPRYLIYAQGMLNQGAYRAIDVPGQPVYSWRPPGLPLLLTPALMFRPYDIIAAKGMVLLTGALLLLAVHALAVLHGGRWSGPLAVALTGSSPVMLVLSTEVLSEVPYALATLALLYWLGRVAEKPKISNTLRFAAIFVTLIWLPAIRTVGVSLIIAVGLWSLVSRWRLPYLLTAALAGGSIYWRAQHGRASGGDNYAASLFDGLRERGLGAVVTEVWQTMQFYSAALPGLLFPGLTKDRPFYALLSLDALPSADGLSLWLSIASIALLLVGLCGVWAQRQRTGGLVLLYLPLYLGCLAVWPWRHERFLWPLIPLLWVFVPAGTATVMQSFRPGTQRWWMPFLALAAAGLCHRQVLSDASLLATNQRAISDRDAFHAREAPSFYFGDWRRAGTWVREQTPPHARLLTWHAAVGGTAHRFQRRVSFETLSPEKLRQQIASFSARYLVVIDAHWGDGFAWQQLSGDPACRLKVVYRERDVAILEVEPNRSGQVSRSAQDDWLQEQLAKLDEFLKQHPDRDDVLVRRTTLLRDLGRNDEAIASLRSLIDKGHASVRVCADLGWALFEERRYAEAAQYLDLARGLPNAEAIAATLADGAEKARARLAETPEETASQSVDRALNRIRSHASLLRWTNAEHEADQLLDLAPERAEAHYWRGYLHHIFGERTQAERHYETAVTLGSEEARAKLELIRLEAAIANELPTELSEPELPEPDEAVSAINPGNQQSPAEASTANADPSSMATHVRLAKLLDEHGWSGRAVAVLEAARTRFGDGPEILVPLADLYRRFARPEEAAPLYRLAQKDWPHEKAIREGLAAAEAALREPKF